MNGRLLGVRTFPGTVEQVAEARRHVRDLLDRNGHRRAADDAELLTSECVTNAIRHVRHEVAHFEWLRRSEVVMVT